MKIIISSHHVTGISGQSFDKYLKKSLNNKISKYIKKYAISAHIIFDKVKNGYNCTLIISQKRIKHYNIRVNEIALSPYDSFNQALSKLTSPLERFKDKAKKRVILQEVI